MIEIQPAKKISGTVSLPGDKSISHRVLILGALARGLSSFKGLAKGADVRSTARLLRQLGAKITEKEETINILGRGENGLQEPGTVLTCGNSGTTARLLTGVLSAQPFFTVLTGDASLRKRPMARIIIPLCEMGAKISGRGRDTLLPLAIQGTSLHGIHYHSPIASAQVKSAILLAGLFAEGETSVTEPVRSRDHTERLFTWLGLPFKQQNRRYTISKAEIPGFSLRIPGDFSSAAYFLALGVSHENANLQIKGVNLNETRLGFLRVVQRMGGRISIELHDRSPEPVGDIFVESSELDNVKLSPAEVPALIDELPLLAVVATQARGECRVSGAGELRVKESDRIQGIVSQLRKMNARIEELEDGFVVEGPCTLQGAKLQSFGDHRLAMSLTVAATLARGPSTISGEPWVTISFPEFFQLLAQIGGVLG